VSITHILFDLYGTLVDSRQMVPCYTEHLGLIMSERYGFTPDRWAEAHRRIVADWDSYYADLDLTGDDGIADMWEGMIRTTRALFRLTGAPQPALAEVTALARELPYLTSRRCDCFYPDAKAVLQSLYQAGYTLGVACHLTTAGTRGVLEGGSVQHWFAGPLLGPDVTGYFVKSEQFFQSSQLLPESVLVVDDEVEGIQGAKASGMYAVLICHGCTPPLSPADHVLKDDLYGLLDYLDIQAG
jgi:phosphoglycolate phosphatase-like HAD superfamily hydrolase